MRFPRQRCLRAHGRWALGLARCALRTPFLPPESSSAAGVAARTRTPQRTDGVGWNRKLKRRRGFAAPSRLPDRAEVDPVWPVIVAENGGSRSRKDHRHPVPALPEARVRSELEALRS